MANINRLPLGWLGFLGIKNGGQYPQEAAQILSPTWDLSALYLSVNSEIANVSVDVPATGNLSIITVPNGEVWYCTQISAATGDLATTQRYSFCLNWSDPAQLVNIEISDTGNYLPAAEGERAYAVRNEPFIAGPGSRLGVTALVLESGPIGTRLKVRYARMPI